MKTNLVEDILTAWHASRCGVRQRSNYYAYGDWTDVTWPPILPNLARQRFNAINPAGEWWR